MKRTAYIVYDGPSRDGFVRTKTVQRAARYGSPITVGVEMDARINQLALTVYNDGRYEVTSREPGVNVTHEYTILTEGRLT